MTRKEMLILVATFLYANKEGYTPPSALEDAEWIVEMAEKRWGELPRAE